MKAPQPNSSFILLPNSQSFFPLFLTSLQPGQENLKHSPGLFLLFIIYYLLFIIYYPLLFLPILIPHSLYSNEKNNLLFCCCLQPSTFTSVCISTNQPPLSWNNEQWPWPPHHHNLVIQPTNHQSLIINYQLHSTSITLILLYSSLFCMLPPFAVADLGGDLRVPWNPPFSGGSSRFVAENCPISICYSF